MTLEMRLVEGHVLDADAVFVAAGLDDAIDEQKGIAVRQEGEQPLDIVNFKGSPRRIVH
jgi:hypothetical protein